MIKKLMTAAALLTMVGTASSATLYTTGVLDFNKTTKGSYLGKIGAAVPVTVLKKQGSLSYVRISGWTLAEYPSMIFAEPDAAEYFGKNCEWIAPKPGTDVAMMIAMAHELESSGKVDREFIRKYTVGYDKFIAYVLGKTDGVAKTPAWAEKICGVKADAIKRLAHLMREKRSMLMGGWGIQRAQHGEQVHWMMVVLAAMCGHIGQPGGGFGFSYHYSNGGAATSMAPALGGISANPKGGSEGLSWVGESLATIPLARFTDCFLNPGKTIDYNGKKITYPDIRLVFWSGGNPFAQQEDTNGLIKAWKRPEQRLCATRCGRPRLALPILFCRPARHSSAWTSRQSVHTRTLVMLPCSRRLNPSTNRIPTSGSIANSPRRWDLKKSSPKVWTKWAGSVAFMRTLPRKPV